MRKALFSILLFSPVFLMAESEPMLEIKISSPIVSCSNEWISEDGRIVCPQCVMEHKKSTVTVGSSMVTAVYCGSGYYDEDGYFHAPEPCNTATTEYRCSRGHTFTKEKRSY